jgi:hypothetical protein
MNESHTTRPLALGRPCPSGQMNAYSFSAYQTLTLFDYNCTLIELTELKATHANINRMRFEVHKPVFLKTNIFWDVTPCRLVNNYLYFEGNISFRKSVNICHCMWHIFHEELNLHYAIFPEKKLSLPGDDKVLLLA